MADRQTGVVKWFSSKKGYGFVSVEGKEDVFVHYSGVIGSGFRDLKEGQKVRFDEAQGRKGLQAINVEVIDEPTA